MKTKLNIAWNNTDWSVSKLKISAQVNQVMKSKPNTLQCGRRTESSPSQPRQVLSPKFASTDLEAGLQKLLDRARNEATALAWESGFTELVLPCLLAEKKASAHDYWRRQLEIRSRTARLFCESLTESQLLAA